MCCDFWQLFPRTLVTNLFPFLYLYPFLKNALCYVVLCVLCFGLIVFKRFIFALPTSRHPLYSFIIFSKNNLTTFDWKLYKTNKQNLEKKNNIATWHLATIPVGGAIRALMMCIHAYFNIWCEARAGWGVFMKRRTAVHKISSLPEATPLQLRSFDDVCAICYQVSKWYSLRKPIRFLSM